MERKIVHTDAVNNALSLVQTSVGGAAAEDFALRMLSLHFEHLHDPNEPTLLKSAFQAVGVPPQVIDAFLAESPTEQAKRNQDMRQKGLQMTGGSVPKFIISCAGSDQDRCAMQPGGPTDPKYFVDVLTSCLEVS